MSLPKGFTRWFKETAKYLRRRRPPKPCNHSGECDLIGHYKEAPLDDGHFTTFYVMRCHCGDLVGFPEPNYRLAREHGTAEVKEKLAALEASPICP